MTTSVIVPTTRSTVDDLVWSLGQGTLKPDEVVVVSNEVAVEGVTLVRFASDTQPIGHGDAGLRRNIGADVATSDVLVFLDDDLIAPREMLEEATRIALKDDFCWGHHRFIDFARYGREKLLELPSFVGRSRETAVNTWHGWQSSYAGLLAIRRNLFWKVGGFDLAYLGHHGSEDQQLGRRLGVGNDFRSFVHEPPFAWHPEVDLFPSRARGEIMEEHRMVRQTVNGHDFDVCEECPCRKPVNVLGLTMSERVVIPYSRSEFTLEKEST